MSELRKMTRMGGDLRKIAKLLQGKGRNGDTILAHINPDEAALLRDYGGAGTTNPDTGLLEFYDGEEVDFSTGLPTSPNVDFSTGEPVSPIESSETFYAPIVMPDPLEGQIAAPSSLSQPLNFAPYVTRTSESTPFDSYRNTLDVLNNIDNPAARSFTGQTPGGMYTLPGEAGTEPVAEKGLLSEIGKGLSKDDKLRLGLGLAGGVQTALTARKARQGAQEYANQIRALGQPYAQRGQAELSAAQRGELSPVGQQQLDAMRARAAQAQAQRGGVGAAQAQRAEEELRQRLNAAREDFGLKLTGIGDQYTAKAIQEGIRADQEIASLYSSYFGNLMKMAAPTVIQTTQPAKG